MIKPILVTLAALSLALPTGAFAAKGNKAGKGDPNRPGKIAREYDTNGNGSIDGTEIDAVKKAFEAAPTGPLKQFDTNNDGKLDDAEIGAIKGGHGKGKGGKKKKNAA